MLQAYRFSCFKPPGNPPREQGCLTPLERPVRKFKIQQNKHFKCFCHKISASADSFSSSADGKPNKKHKRLKRIFHGELEHGFFLQAKDVKWTTFRSDLWRKLDAFYRFSRPHTVIGTIIGITSVSLLPLGSIGDLSPAFFVGILKALIPSIFMNIYVVGLNQLFDVEIDKVNKPNLPLASGEYSMELAKAIVTASGFMSFAMGIMFQSPPLFSALLISFLFGSVYSIEILLGVAMSESRVYSVYPSQSLTDIPFYGRWKRNALLAASCILIVRAITVQLAFFLHIQKYVLGRPVVFTRSLGFAICCMCLFTTVIALFKDIPDVDGDRDFGIQSLSVSLGQKRVFWLCISMLLIAYGSAVVIGASSSLLWCKLVTVLGHCTLASVLWLQAQSVNLNENASVTSFYMFIWKLFYAEYLLIPFVR